MAITASGLYCANFVSSLNATQLALNIVGDTVKVAMFTNSITPNFNTDTAYSSTNEVSGTGYTAGGATTTSKTLTTATGSVTWDMDDASWTTSTITNARGALLYDTTVSNSSICLVNFGADYSTSAGTFTIQWSASGVFVLDLTP